MQFNVFPFYRTTQPRYGPFMEHVIRDNRNRNQSKKVLVLVCRKIKYIAVYSVHGVLGGERLG